MSRDLCEELIFEIFTRLPSKSLLRFRSLSKSLYSCIASPDFIRKHTSRSPQKLLIRHTVDNKHIKSMYTLHSANQLPLCPTHGYIGIEAVESPYSTYWTCVGSCNGLLCMFDGCHVSLWNPSIRVKLTPDCPPGYVDCPPGYSYCFTTSDYKRIGFGFDPIIDDYKIVSLPKHQGSGESSYVYAMKTGVWCAIACPTPSYDYMYSSACFVNGALHWAVKSRVAGSHDHLEYCYIMTFSLSTHVFGKIDLPQPCRSSGRLMTIQGSLAMVCREHDDQWIWVMREYGNTDSWSVFFKTKLNQVKGKLYVVLQQTINGDLLFQTVYEGFHVYDPKTGVQSKLQSRLRNRNDIFAVETCVESLQLLDMGTR